MRLLAAKTDHSGFRHLSRSHRGAKDAYIFKKCCKANAAIDRYAARTMMTTWAKLTRRIMRSFRANARVGSACPRKLNPGGVGRVDDKIANLHFVCELEERASHNWDGPRFYLRISRSHRHSWLQRRTTRSPRKKRGWKRSGERVALC